MPAGSENETVSPNRSAFRISAIYALCASAYIVVSDLLVATSDRSFFDSQWVQTLKGLTFVAITASLLFLLVRSTVARLVDLTHRAGETQRRYIRLVEQSTEAILSLDRHCRVRLANQAAGRLFDRPATMLHGQSLPDLLGDPARGILTRLCDGDADLSPNALHDIRLTVEGQTRWVQITVTRHDPSADEALTVVLTDVTARRAAEDQARTFSSELERRVIQRTAQLDLARLELEHFARTVSHDLRQPLRTLTAMATDLVREIDGRIDDEPMRQARRIVGASARLEALVGEMLQVARMAVNEVPQQPLSLALLTNEIISQIRRERGDAADFDLIEPMPWAMGHRATLARAIGNLLRNAVDHAGAHIRPVVRVWTETDGPWVRLIVEDNGPGLPAPVRRWLNGPSDAPGDLVAARAAPNGADAAARVVAASREPLSGDSPFACLEAESTTSEFVPTGIGLVVAKHAVQRSGGKIAAHDTPSGARIVIELRSAEAVAASMS